MKTIGIGLVLAAFSASTVFAQDQGASIADLEQKFAVVMKQLASETQKSADLAKQVAELKAKTAPTPKQQAKSIREALKRECSSNGLTFDRLSVDRKTGNATLICK